MPTTIRKDFWQPLATVSFPSGPQGLSAYQQLREYRKRHEHEWTAPRCKPRKLVGRELRDQKANSIADLAAVLLGQEKIAAQHKAEYTAKQTRIEQARQQAQARLATLIAERKEAAKKQDLEQYKALKREKMKLVKAMASPEPYAALHAEYSSLNDRRAPAKRGLGRQRGSAEKPLVTLDGVNIAWANVLDAEFASTWPRGVVHKDLSAAGTRVRNVPPKPDAAGPVTKSEAVVDEVIEKQALKTPKAAVKESKEPEWDDRTTMQRLVDRLRFGKGQ